MNGVNRTAVGAANQIARAAEQVRKANEQALIGNTGKANALAVAAANNMASAANKLGGAVNTAKNLGLGETANKLRNAEEAVKKALLARALGNVGAAITSLNNKNVTARGP